MNVLEPIEADFLLNLSNQSTDFNHTGSPMYNNYSTNLHQDSEPLPNAEYFLHNVNEVFQAN